MELRQLELRDYDPIIMSVNAWYGGREMSKILPRLFFTHFRNTSFVIEKDGIIAGFLVGFLSPTMPDEAYVHFIAVHPDYRRRGIARKLYNAFFELVKSAGRTVVKGVTSPINKLSLSFHPHMGFGFEPGDTIIDGVPVHTKYDGPGEDKDRVVFFKKLT